MNIKLKSGDRDACPKSAFDPLAKWRQSRNDINTQPYPEAVAEGVLLLEETVKS